MGFLHLKSRVNKANGQINLAVLKKKVPKRLVSKFMSGGSIKVNMKSFEFDDSLTD